MLKCMREKMNNYLNLLFFQCAFSTVVVFVASLTCRLLIGQTPKQAFEPRKKQKQSRGSNSVATMKSH